MSSFTRSSSSRSLISVSRSSAPPSSTSFDQLLLDLDQLRRCAPRPCRGRRTCAPARCAAGRCGRPGRWPDFPRPDSTSGRSGSRARRRSGSGPAPPALSDSTKKGVSSSSWKRSTSSRRLATGVPPCSTRPSRPKIAPRKAASGSVISRNWVNTSTFSCRAAITSTSSRRRANLPLSSARPAAVAQPLRRMVADLLEAHQEGQHDAPAADAVGIIQRARQLLRPPADTAPPAPGSDGTRP